MSDSTHPKSPDSWVLYTHEFYQTVQSRLSEDGVFLQWLPTHHMSLAEYLIVLKTFQSVFPHTSVWVVAGNDEIGFQWTTTLLMGTPERLSIDVGSWRKRLAHPAVQADLRPWSMHEPVHILETFLCGEDTVRKETAPVAIPINTDDLPYTQYLTRFTRWRLVEDALDELLESVWPFLTNTGDRSESRALKAMLDRHRKAKRLYLQGEEDKAIALLPECPKMQRIKQHMESGKRYRSRLKEQYGD